MEMNFTLFAFFHALLTSAFIWPNIFLPVFLAVIVKDFFTRLYRALCHNENAVLAHLRFSIRTARMINVSGTVVTRFSIDSHARVDLEQIFAINRIFFGGANGAADIFDNAFSLGNLIHSKKSEACC